MFEKLFMKILKKDRKPKQISILIIGLNNSGKSTIVNFFKNKDDRKSISVPTIGFNIEHFESKLCLLPNSNSYDFDLPQHSETNFKAYWSIICDSMLNFFPFRRSGCLVHSLWHGRHRPLSQLVGAPLQNVQRNFVRDWFERPNAFG